MAEFDLANDGLASALALSRNAPLLSSVDAWGFNFWSVVMPIYKMRGQDAAVSGAYDTWLAAGSPDLDASEYRGSLARPLRDVVVIDEWSSQ